MKFKKFTMNELKDALINLDPKIVTSDACSTLLPFCPDAEEMQICKSFDGNLEELDMSSQYMIAMINVPRMQIRLRTFERTSNAKSFRSTFCGQ